MVTTRTLTAPLPPVAPRPAATVGRWPTPGTPLACRVHPERQDLDDNAFDRWVAGWWLAHDGSAARRRRDDARLLSMLDGHAAAAAALDDGALAAACRAAARPAFTGLRLADGAAALALICEAVQRTLGLHPHPPQRVAAWRLACGRMVELDTGEGKTLTAAMAAAMAALAGVPTHVVTVNDYLAQRDAGTMGPLFTFLGLRVGVVHSGVAQGARAAEYACDLTYCTNKDLVFDYLRDRVSTPGNASAAQVAVRRLRHGETRGAGALRLRGLHYAIVDEADSILVDEARTPLILSALHDDGAGAEVWRAVLDVAAGLVDGRHYKLVGDQRVPELQREGRRQLEADAAGARHGLPADWALEWVREHYVVQALRALHVLRRDEHYVVLDGKIVIVDEFTGRLLPDRSWEQGLHQLVEAKEGCAPSGQNRTLARLTYQTFFARYLRLAGMSGTLREVAGEMAAVYRAPTVRVEPNRPCQRVEHAPLLLRDEAAKLAAVVDEVRARSAAGQPVLVGTRSVRASQAVSAALLAAGIAHRVLNALQDADEAALVAAAGQPGAVTVATNMAGRGTDIPLAPGVAERGGLHVVLTEWHESPRVDRQLFGRCARQGDPGSCRAIVALDDDLILRHAGRLGRWLAAHTAAGVAPLPGTWLQRWAARGLRRVVQYDAESAHAAQRRATLRHDRQMRQQLAFSGVPE